MANKEVDSSLIADLIFYYEEKKRLTVKGYKFIDTQADRKYFMEAAKLCQEQELDASTYVQIMYDRMETKKEFFSPRCLQGVKAKHFLEESSEPSRSWKIEITNANLDPSELWRYQHELASIYISKGESVESVLIDSSLKFFAWFRILATPDRIPAVIAKYKNIAKKEMTSRLFEFAKSENLDLDRLL